MEADEAVAAELGVIQVLFVGCGGDGFTIKIIGVVRSCVPGCLDIKRNDIKM